MGRPGSEEWLAELLKKRETDFVSQLRTRQPVAVATTTQAVVDRIFHTPVISDMIAFYSCISVHFREDRHRFQQDTVLSELLARLATEPRALIRLENSANTFSVELQLNCRNTLVKEQIEGKQREIPEKADLSHLFFRFSGESYCTSAFLEPFLHMIGECFSIIGGDYGWGRNLWLDVWANDYDQGHGDLFSPEFIAWANLLGPQHVDRLGRERFLSVPAHSCVELPGGGILLTMCADPRQFLTPQVQDIVSRAKKHLGILSPSERFPNQAASAVEAAAQEARREAVSPFAEMFRKADEETPGEMARQAEGTIEGVLRHWNIALDYSPASILAIDRLILTAFTSNEEEEIIETGVQAFGAHLGESVRRHYGTWRDEDMKGQPVLLGVGPKRHRIDPFAVVRQRFDARTNGVSLLDWWNTIDADELPT